MQDQDQNGDHDLIPDERQEPEAPRQEQPLAKPRTSDEHDFGQMAKHPKKPEKLEPKKRKAENWEPLDVSTGIYSGKDLRVSRNVFEKHVREDIRSELPKFSQRNALAKELSSKRGNKLTKTETRDAIKKLEDEKKITHFQARKLRGKFGARSSSLF